MFSFAGPCCQRVRRSMHLGQRHPGAEFTTPITIASSLGIIHALQQGPGIGVVADFAAQAALQAGRVQRQRACDALHRNIHNWSDQ